MRNLEAKGELRTAAVFEGEIKVNGKTSIKI